MGFVVIEGEVFIRDDSGNGPVAVKPSSTSPSATDQALVVVLSPNQQAIPVSSTPATSTAGLAFGRVQLGGGTSGSLNEVLATPYTEQSSDAQRSVASDDGNDTSAGTGARTILLTYLDVTGAGPFTETVTLNGTTAVNTTNTDICFIESLEVLTAGSVGTNAGTITLFAATGGGGGTVATIGVGNITSGVGDGRTLWAQHYVPLGATLNITGVAFGASNDTTFHVRSRDVSAVTSPEMIVSGFLATQAMFQRNYGSPLRVTGPARVLAYGVPSTNNTLLLGSFDFFEE